MNHTFTRREFLELTTLAGATIATGTLAGAEASTGPSVMTVRGLVPADQLGVTLPHEHITTDFLGAEKLPQPRYDRSLAFDTILPQLKALKARGASSLFECTPNYIGRDVALLKRLQIRPRKNHC